MVRIDDIGFHDARDQFIISELCKASIRVTCGAVPTWVTQECANFLKSIARQYPGCLEIHQHGYSHKNHAPEDAPWDYEFGPVCSLAQQFDNISRGRMMLEKVFEDLFFPAFSPPFAELDGNTLIALQRTGFVAVSHYPPRLHYALPNFSPALECFDWHPMRQKTWSEIERAWHQSAQEGLPGIILHPSLMSHPSVSTLKSRLPALLAGYHSVHIEQLVQHQVA